MMGILKRQSILFWVKIAIAPPMMFAMRSLKFAKTYPKISTIQLWNAPKGFVDDHNFQNWIMHTLRYGFGKKPQCP
ncbi:MAG: hypothetical protein V7K18_14985 [Nostoc sp.]